MSDPERTDTFNLDIRLRHDTAELSEVALELGLHVSKKWKAGEKIRTKSGQLTGSEYIQSYVCSKVASSRDTALLTDVLQTWIDKMQAHEDALRRFEQDGGMVEFLLGWFFERTAGMEITPGLLARMGALHISLSIMAYGAPESGAD